MVTHTHDADEVPQGATRLLLGRWLRVDQARTSQRVAPSGFTTSRLLERGRRAGRRKLLFINQYYWPDHASTAQHLTDLAESLVGQGYEPQVADVAGLSTVFVHERGVKRRVPLAEAAGLARSADPESLSPNVLLRPVVERAILPTVAYLPGPGELAYFAQVSAVAAALGAAQPLAVPRWSCTIVEPAVDRALGRLGAGLDDLQQADALVARAARDSVPENVRESLEGLRLAVGEGLRAVADADGGALLADGVVTGAERQIGFRLDRLERRLLAAAKRRGNDALRDLAFARAHIWPDGHPQERTLNFIPFLARYGEGLWTAMREAAGEHARRVLRGSGASGDR